MLLPNLHKINIFPWQTLRPSSVLLLFYSVDHYKNIKPSGVRDWAEGCVEVMIE